MVEKSSKSLNDENYGVVELGMGVEPLYVVVNTEIIANFAYPKQLYPTFSSRFVDRKVGVVYNQVIFILRKIKPNSFIGGGIN